MRSAAAAEWILSLVTDHAASTVGDLTEEASSRGALWFWSSVLRTASSHFWHDLSASPLRMLGLAFWGVFAIWFFLAALIVAPLMVVHRLWTPSSWGMSLISVAGYAAGAFLAGRGVAMRSAGRELPAAFAVVALKGVLYVLELQLSAMQARRIGQPYPGIEHAFAICCIEALFVTAGATVYRLRILAARKDASQTWSRYLGS